MLVDTSYLTLTTVAIRHVDACEYLLIHFFQYYFPSNNIAIIYLSDEIRMN